MINVSDATKEAFFDPSSTKNLIVTFIHREWTGNNQFEYDQYVETSYVHPMELILSDSLVIKEEMLTSGVWTFGGCIPTSAELTFVSHLGTEEVEVDSISTFIDIKVQANDTDIIPLFHGKIHEISYGTNNDRVTIKAYDGLYALGEISLVNYRITEGVSEYWYVNKFPSGFQLLNWHPSTLFTFMDYFVREYISFSGEDNYKYDVKMTRNWSRKSRSLDNCEIYVKLDDQYGYIAWDYFLPDVRNITMLELLRLYCEMNCLYGYVDRQTNTIDFLEIDDIDEYKAQEVPWYKDLKHTDSENRYGLERVIYTNSNNEELYADGSVNGSTYEVRTNPFNDKISNWRGRPSDSWSRFSTENDKYTITTPPMPWLEVGKDCITYRFYSYTHGYLTPPTTENKWELERTECIYNRTITGIQTMMDTYDYQVDLPDSRRATMDQRMNRLEQSQLSARYVTEVPENMQSNTIYFVRKS